MRAGQRTHGTTFRPLKLTSQVSTPGAESAVYDCLVVRLFPADLKFGDVGRDVSSQESHRLNAVTASTPVPRQPPPVGGQRSLPGTRRATLGLLISHSLPLENPENILTLVVHKHASVTKQYRQRAVTAHGRECNRSSNSRVPAGGRYQGPRRATLTHRPSIQHQANRLAGKNVSDVTYFVSSAWNLELCSIHPQAQYQSSSPPLEPRTR